MSRDQFAGAVAASGILDTDAVQPPRQFVMGTGLAELVQRHMKEHRLSVNKAADLWMVRKQTITEILAGREIITPLRLPYWSDILGMSEQVIRDAINVTQARRGHQPMPGVDPYQPRPIRH